MKKILESAANTIAPSPEELWERGHAVMQDIEIDPGRHEQVPFFDLEITHRGKRHIKPMFDDLERQIGESITRTYVTNDGIDRATRTFLPENRRDDFIVAMTTPWWTSIDGLNSDNAEAISNALGVAVVLIGAEHSARKHSILLDFVRLPKTIKQSKTISLAKTAQSGQLITADICEEYNLPKVIVKTGESRGAMETDAEYVYSKQYGLYIPYQDKTALCLPDRLFSIESESNTLLGFPAAEIGGAAIVGATTIAKNTGRNFAGTVCPNPNFNMSSLIGIGPALASGEAGRFIRWLPINSAGHQVTFDSDFASRPQRQRDLYIGHHLMSIITLRGSHATLAHLETLRHLIERIEKFGIEYELCKGDVSKINWNNVHLKDDDLYLQIA